MPGYDDLMIRVFSWALFPALLFVPTTSAVSSGAGAPETLPPVNQIVDRMQQHDAAQAVELKTYEAVRHYHVQYKGYAATLAADMEVEVNFDSASGKSFRILSQSGSKLLCDKVLKKAVSSEEEASHDKSATALSPANYRFEVVGTELLNGRPSYILHVQPLTEGKFLYRGKVWVDAADYAVAKIEVEPAKNPSFWISSTHIVSTNAEDRGVWLPEMNRSESKIRIGGTAVLTIDYGTYRIGLANQHTSASIHIAGPAVTEAAF